MVAVAVPPEIDDRFLRPMPGLLFRSIRFGGREGQGRMKITSSDPLANANVMLLYECQRAGVCGRNQRHWRKRRSHHGEMSELRERELSLYTEF